MADVVVDLNDARPIWAQPPWFAEELRAALPADLSLAVLTTLSEGTGDGATRVSDEVREAVRDARIYMGFGVAADVLEAGPRLEWVHTGSAGVGSSISPTMLARRPIFTNSAGIHAPPMAEAVLGMILFFFRGFDFAVRAQAERRWHTGPFYRADAPLHELAGATVGIVGYGGIGRAVGERVAALGATVRPLNSTDGPDAFAELLAASDVVVVTAPDTPRTRGMFDRAAFARMKKGALFVNVSRGLLVDEPALIDALTSEHLRGAALDVVAHEPLDGDSPLWGLSNVLITPHVSPVSRGFWRREADLVLHNLRCFLGGRPHEMRNRVDLERGY